MEISRARDRAVLVTDDARRLREQLETATGERISALEGIGHATPDGPTTKAAEPKPARQPDRDKAVSADLDASGSESPARDRETAVPVARKPVEMDLGL